jgi:hypothetical protein
MTKVTVKAAGKLFSFLEAAKSLDDDDGVDVRKKFGPAAKGINDVEDSLDDDDGLDPEATTLKKGDKKLDTSNSAAKNKAGVKDTKIGESCDLDDEDADEDDKVEKDKKKVKKAEDDKDADEDDRHELEESLNKMRKIAGLPINESTVNTIDTVYVLFEDMNSPKILGTFVNSKEARDYLDRAKKQVASLNTSKKPQLRAFALATNNV